MPDFRLQIVIGDDTLALRTALYDWHLAQGARLVEFAGWDLPIQYTSIVEEHQAVRTAAGIFDISHMGRLFLTGPDALDLIQKIYTNNAASMRVGQARYGLICNSEGGILDDVVVYRFQQSWLMVVNASNREKILGWLECQRGGLRVQVLDGTRAWPMVAVQGPRARDIITQLMRREPWNEGMSAPSLDDLKYYHVLLRGKELPGDLILSRTGYTGEDGFEATTPENIFMAFINDLLDSAREVGISLKPCGLGARDTLRLEAAMPLYGHELDETRDPMQAGLNWAVKFEKPDFIGRDALLRRRQEAGFPCRVGLELEGKRIAREGAAIRAQGREIGRLTSGTFSPTLQRPIGMGYVEPSFKTPGSVCEVDIRGQSVPARVRKLPFYRRPSP